MKNTNKALLSVVCVLMVQGIGWPTGSFLGVTSVQGSTVELNERSMNLMKEPVKENEGDVSPLNFIQRNVYVDPDLQAWLSAKLKEQRWITLGDHSRGVLWLVSTEDRLLGYILSSEDGKTVFEYGKEVPNAWLQEASELHYVAPGVMVRSEIRDGQNVWINVANEDLLPQGEFTVTSIATVPKAASESNIKSPTNTIQDLQVTRSFKSDLSVENVLGVLVRQAMEDGQLISDVDVKKISEKGGYVVNSAIQKADHQRDYFVVMGLQKWMQMKDRLYVTVTDLPSGRSFTVRANDQMTFIAEE